MRPRRSQTPPTPADPIRQPPKGLPKPSEPPKPWEPAPKPDPENPKPDPIPV